MSLLGRLFKKKAAVAFELHQKPTTNNSLILESASIDNDDSIDGSDQLVAQRPTNNVELKLDTKVICKTGRSNGNYGSLKRRISLSSLYSDVIIDGTLAPGYKSSVISASLSTLAPKSPLALHFSALSDPINNTNEHSQNPDRHSSSNDINMAQDSFVPVLSNNTESMPISGSHRASLVSSINGEVICSQLSLQHSTSDCIDFAKYYMESVVDGKAASNVVTNIEVLATSADSTFLDHLDLALPREAEKNTGNHIDLETVAIEKILNKLEPSQIPVSPNRSNYNNPSDIPPSFILHHNTPILPSISSESAQKKLLNRTSSPLDATKNYIDKSHIEHRKFNLFHRGNNLFRSFSRSSSFEPAVSGDELLDSSSIIDKKSILSQTTKRLDRTTSLRLPKRSTAKSPPLRPDSTSLLSTNSKTFKTAAIPAFVDPCISATTNPDRHTSIPAPTKSPTTNALLNTTPLPSKTPLSRTHSFKVFKSPKLATPSVKSLDLPEKSTMCVLEPISMPSAMIEAFTTPELTLPDLPQDTWHLFETLKRASKNAAKDDDTFQIIQTVVGTENTNLAPDTLKPPVFESDDVDELVVQSKLLRLQMSKVAMSVQDEYDARMKASSSVAETNALFSMSPYDNRYAVSDILKQLDVDTAMLKQNSSPVIASSHLGSNKADSQTTQSPLSIQSNIYKESSSNPAHAPSDIPFAVTSMNDITDSSAMVRHYLLHHGQLKADTPTINDVYIPQAALMGQSNHDGGYAHSLDFHSKPHLSLGHQPLTSLPISDRTLGHHDHSESTPDGLPLALPKNNVGSQRKGKLEAGQGKKGLPDGESKLLNSSTILTLSSLERSKKADKRISILLPEHVPEFSSLNRHMSNL
ncbi:hypothetical protein BATDEDRAFT_21704 [Batrachochytrium dendrobatidis JAM81]|uniref:Uncharacterized protein n=1 Tax=Batrachochytrium dendrobatidis (strain JAM81 / FGSC 10211) TaxID=684364 RepID=F4NUP7_BATDJ|nr:uncharacterized protein BATDEDRAFT_21704 [Batrachochytrium dendrobatidis JAM81]EGF83210.1 hypothetical protein BATDEDRAFT_21704 [Batrachochytrium dendrobatidis JAM81]|eukprot:XP_006675357.1 hypothetical protein BATDEDRAFT_21704 [Batrachochytrium dendrobatidis JAM81]